jgi:hypothetical protein
MDKTTFKNQLRAIFHKFNTDPQIHGVKFEEDIKLEAEAKLQDGTSVYTSATEWAPGVDCYTKDEAGQPIPAPAGEYLLEDGSVLVIGEDGLVAEIKAMEPEAEEMSSADTLAMVEALSNRISVLEAMHAEANAKFAKEVERAVKLSKENAELKTEVATLRKAPAVNSVKNTNGEEVNHVFGRRAKKEVKEKTWAEMTILERIMANAPTSK